MKDIYLRQRSVILSSVQVWLSNVPHTQLVSYKADQNWVKVSPDQQKLIFPGGGTQFKHGASHYIDFLQEVRMCNRACISKFTIDGVSKGDAFARIQLNCCNAVTMKA